MQAVLVIVMAVFYIKPMKYAGNWSGWKEKF